MSAQRQTAYLRWIRQQARKLRSGQQLPPSLQAWQARRRELREQVFAAVDRGLQEEACSLEPRVVGVLQREGYRIEKLLFQSRPGVWVTANAYVPDHASERPVPAVLNVHGHFSSGKLASVPHRRALGLVRLGYFVLAVDAFGAGERSPDPLKPIYHGALRGAACWTIGYPLWALQVYDNMRAVDYLLTRPEVDPKRIAVTGASGGGNQSMNVGALDERLAVVVPVCSVGNYQAYLGVACCVGEVLPGALTFCEEGEILGLVAPRPLLVINAAHDSVQFSIIEAAKSIAVARSIYTLYGCPERIKHAVFDDRHGYSRPMRETLYGWLNRWLRGAASDAPLSEPELKEEPPGRLRCFPSGKRFAGFLTQTAFVASRWKQINAAAPQPDHREAWESLRLVLETRLEKLLNFITPRAAVARQVPNGLERLRDGAFRQRIELEPEPGIVLRASFLTRTSAQGGIVIVVDPDAHLTTPEHPLVRGLLSNNQKVMLLELRATGSMAYPADRIREAVDHNSVEWSVWIGRPLLGLWMTDLWAAIDYVAQRADVDAARIKLLGAGAGGLAAIATAALRSEVAAVGTVEMLASFAADAAPEGHRMAYFVPHLYRVGDIPTLAALVAPRPLILAKPRHLSGRTLSQREAVEHFAFTSRVYGFYGARRDVRVLASQEPLRPLVEVLSAV